MGTIWENTDISESEELLGEISTECVVLGGGLAGIMTAYELQSRGCEVVVLEADRILSGATKGTTAKLTAQHGLIYGKLMEKHSPLFARLYHDSNTEGIDKVETLVHRENIDCEFERVDSYYYETLDAEPLLEEKEALDKLGIEAEFSEKTSLPIFVSGALCMKGQARFHPLKFASHLAKSLKIYEKSPAIGIKNSRVITPKGKVSAKYIVNCTHYPVVNFPGLYFLRQHQERSYLMAVKTDKRVGGVYLGGDGHTLRDYSEGVLIGGEAHRTGKGKGGCYQRLACFAKKCFPQGEIAASWSNQDCITHDGLPFIGRYSVFRDNMFVATGFGKWGMSLSAVSSILIPDLIEAKANKYEKLYTPRRVNIIAAAPKLITDVGYSVAGLTKGFFGKKEERCSHLGCKLSPNTDENTLECPCHGSQFTRAGEVVFSPAKKPLNKKKG